MTAPRPILAVDVGGTKVVCARVDAAGGRLRVAHQERYPSRDHESLDAIVAAYLRAHGFRPAAISVGVAGPVDRRQAKLTNLPWLVDADHLAQATGVTTHLLNDLEALAYGLEDCAPERIIALNAGDGRPGNRALIAAGTGLGQALLFFDGERHRPSASEGGHCAFAPVTADDDALLAHIRQVHHHVSWERVVSGLDGFRNMYDFLVAVRGAQPSAALARAAAEAHDIGAAVIEGAGAGDAVAVAILRWFARLYGAEAGNLALKGLTVGGVYVGGGIAPRILPYLQAEFLAGMTAKGRFRDLLTRMPVRVVADADAALLGAARYASDFAAYS